MEKLLCVYVDANVIEPDDLALAIYKEIDDCLCWWAYLDDTDTYEFQFGGEHHFLDPYEISIIEDILAEYV